MIREVVVVDGKGDLSRCIAFDVARLCDAIRAIEAGDTDSTIVADPKASVVLMERSAARRSGQTSYALISAGAEPPDAEEFDAAPSLCEAVQAAALSIYHRHLASGLGRATPRPWLSTPRLALIRSACSLILSETHDQVTRPATTFLPRSPQIFLFEAGTPGELVDQVNLLRVDGPLPKIAAATRARCYDRGHSAFGIALMARTPEELLREIGMACSGVPRAMQSGTDWKTPSGSCFTPAPLGANGVAFVFPGVGSPYVGVGAELFAIAPGLMDGFQRMARGEAARYLHAEVIYPREDANPAAFFSDVVALGECAMSISAVMAMFLRDVLGVAPRSALGYSFGEAIMPAALGLWPEPTMLTERLNASPAFRLRLHGPMHAIRESWSIPEAAPLRWGSYCARATPAQAFAALQPEGRVYLCIINSPDEVVIAGDEDGCARVLSRLGSPVVPLPLPVTMHCEPARSEHAEFVHIHDLETFGVEGLSLFSCADYRPVRHDRKSLATAIADGYTKMVDFPRLVRQVYSQGPRLFLEVGGRRNCSTWIEKILRGRPHAAIPCDTQGLSSDGALLRAIARLFTHRVPLKLESLDTSPV